MALTSQPTSSSFAWVITLATLTSARSAAAILNLEPPLPPFQAYWNAPIERCGEKYGINIGEELRKYGIVVNPGEVFDGQNITIFYHAQIGIYPYVDENGTAVNGGVPQAVNLTTHLEKSAQDIITCIPWPDFSGLAIIDWEAWRPVWSRNWDDKRVYQNLSEALVRSQHPDWPPDNVTRQAKVEFETAAREMITETLQLARSLRPGGSWGYYLFPACYGALGEKECPADEEKLNDELDWLFNASSGLYPSIYFRGDWNSTVDRGHVHAVVNEARRVRGLQKELQVYVYTRFTYSNMDPDVEFYTSSAIYNSVDMAAMMGASGVVFWGNKYPSENLTMCSNLRDFIRTVLGPGVQTGIEFSTMCSNEMCGGHGRCVLPTYFTTEAAYELVDELRMKVEVHQEKRKFESSLSKLLFAKSKALNPVAIYGLSMLLGSNRGFVGDNRGMSHNMVWGKAHNKQMSNVNIEMGKNVMGSNKGTAIDPQNSVITFDQFGSKDAVSAFLQENVPQFGCDCYPGWTGYHCEVPE